MPLLIVHGDLDRTVPFDFGQALYNKAAEPKQFIQIVGAGHNDLYDHGAASGIMGFLGQVPGLITN